MTQGKKSCSNNLGIRLCFSGFAKIVVQGIRQLRVVCSAISKAVLGNDKRMPHCCMYVCVFHVFLPLSVFAIYHVQWCCPTTP